uniref:Ig-like domain-containing protein n=1 Tax=Hucho hucho TaxID=62062 RepID=A0A4W5PYX3_9TELE
RKSEVTRAVPQHRWFCEGRELHHCPDIQIWRDGALHTLVIAEAFEDDTGRYTCVASNSLGADNTSAEVYIQGASSSDSEGEGSVSKSRSGAMPQYVCVCVCMNVCVCACLCLSMNLSPPLTL